MNGRSAGRTLPGDASRWRIAALLAVGCWCVYLATAGGTLATLDAVTVYDEAVSMLDRGTFAIPPSASTEDWRGPDGRYYSPFGVGQALYDVPFILAARSAVRLTGLHLGDADTMPKAAVAVSSTVTAALCVAFTFLLACELGARTKAAGVGAIVAAFGTLLWPYSKFGFNAMLTAASLAGGVWLYAAGWRTRRLGMALAGGCFLGFALLTRYELLLASLTAYAWLFVQARRDDRWLRWSIAAGIGIVASIALAAIRNLVRFGNPLWTGYRPQYSGAGFVGYTISPSGAFLLYSPIAIAGLLLVRLAWRGNRTARLLLVVSVTLGLYYATLDDWLGTRSYGPRYLVPLIPLLTAPLGLWLSRTTRRALLTALCAVSILLQLPAVVIDFSKAGIAAGQPPQRERMMSWHWSPVWLNARAAVEAVPQNVRLVVSGTRPAIGARSETLQERVQFSLDFWWLYLYYLGALGRSAALAVAVALSSAGTALLLLACRRAEWADRSG